MASIETNRLSDSEVQKLLACSEGHFLDLKSREIKPSKLSRTIAAFANAEGGELFVGIVEDKQQNASTGMVFRMRKQQMGMYRSLTSFSLLALIQQ